MANEWVPRIAAPTSAGDFRRKCSANNVAEYRLVRLEHTNPPHAQVRTRMTGRIVVVLSQVEESGDQRIFSGPGISEPGLLAHQLKLWM